MDDFDKIYAVFPINKNPRECSCAREDVDSADSRIAPPGFIRFLRQRNLMGRAAQPVELSPAYFYLATDDSTYVVGTTLHVNRGE